MTKSCIALPDEAATTRTGEAMGRVVRRLDTLPGLALGGELGAGKTTLARGLLRGLGHKGPVPSPTYTLLEPYQCRNIAVSHLDLYRLSDGSELDALGWRDLGNTVRIVEWPERVPALLTSLDLTVTLQWAGIARELSWHANTALGERWMALAVSGLEAL